jgi:hypothetical protein
MSEPTVVSIRFTHNWTNEQLEASALEFANQLCPHIDGLVWKIFLREGNTSGGIYLFESRVQAEAYLNSDVISLLRSKPGLAAFTAELTGIVEHASTMTGARLSDAV